MGERKAMHVSNLFPVAALRREVQAGYVRERPHPKLPLRLFSYAPQVLLRIGRCRQVSHTKWMRSRCVPCPGGGGSRFLNLPHRGRLVLRRCRPHVRRKKQPSRQRDATAEDPTVTVEVHHIKPDPEHESRRFKEHGLSWDERRDWYEHVATLAFPTASSTDEALNFTWGETQHARKAWLREEGVWWVKEEALVRIRSSAIGGVFVVAPSGDESEDAGEAVPHQVDFAGFSDIRGPICRDRKAGPDGEVPFYGMEDGEWSEDA